MELKGTIHKISSVFLRFGELVCGLVVLGIFGRFCYIIHGANVSVDGRIIYSMVTAAIGIIFSLAVCPPFNILFLGFPFDFVMFIMWLVAFCLLETRTGTNTCSSSWYHSYWGYYWGRFWRVGPIGTVSTNGVGCPQWRATLAFSFIALWLHLLSGILGVYVLRTYIKLNRTAESVRRDNRRFSWHKSPRTAEDYSQQEPEPSGRAIATTSQDKV